MISATITSKIFSELASSSSLLPIGVKDVSNSLGITAGSYITGSKVEGKDRFIDEFGTQAIWLGGIPFYKKILDLTLYKIKDFNPKVDVRILKDKEILAKAIEHAPSPKIKEKFVKIAENQKVFKNLFMAKFIAATALTMASYSALTHFRHKHTEKAIAKEIQQEENIKKANDQFIKSKSSLTFKAFNKSNTQKNNTAKKNPTFGMNLSGLQDFMFNPVKNMMIVDGGITTERLADSRNPQDFVGYVIKEGFFWGFMYFAGQIIQDHFEKRAKLKHNTSIDLDIKVLQNEEFKESFKTKEIKDSLSDFETVLDKKDAEIYEYLHKNPKNMIVKMAKESDIITAYKEKNAAGKMIKTNKIDTQHYVDIKNVKSLYNKIKTLYEELGDHYKKTGESKETLNAFFKQVTNLKRLSIIKNIGACVGVLGVLVPGIMVATRFMNKDNKEFQVKKEIKEKIAAQNFQGK